MTEKTPIVEFYVEKRNFLRELNIIPQLRDDIVVHYNLDTQEIYHILPKGGKLEINFPSLIECNKLTIYTIPQKETSWGEYYTGGINLFIQFKINNVWRDSDWEYFDLDGANEGKQPHYVGRSYIVRSGILSIWAGEEIQKIQGIRIWSESHNHKITEIKLTKVYKFNPVNLRINETSTVDDIYTGMSGQAVFVDSYFHIKNSVDINDDIYVKIIDDKKIKEINWLYCDKIYYDVDNRTTIINFNSKIMQMMTKMVNVKTPILENCEVKKILELLLLQANIHRDLIHFSVPGYMSYYPEYRPILDEINDILQVAGDVKYFVFNKKLYISARAKTTPVILAQGVENRINRIPPNYIYPYGIPYCRITRTFCDFFDIWKIGFLDRGSNFNFIEKMPEQFRWRILNGGEIAILSSLLLYRDEIKTFPTGIKIRFREDRTYWFFEFDPIPSGNIKFESFYLSVTVPTFNVPTRYYIRFSQTIEKELKDRPVEIIWVEWTIKVFNTITGGVLYTYSKRDTYNRRYERGIIGLSLRAINCILDIKSFAYCFGFYDEIVYEFSTPNVYSYLTSYENSLGTAEYKASKSDRDTKSILIQNGKILSIPGERIKIYYFSYPTIPARYQFLGDDILSVECPPLEVREKIYLTYTTIDEQDVEQGIVEVKNPKNLVYLITTAYDNQSLITNQVLIKNYGYYFSNQKLIEDSFVLTQEYNRTFITEAIDPQSCRLQLIVQGIGQWNYRPGEYYNDAAKLKIKFFAATLQIQLVLTPTENISRDVRIEITADKLMIKYKNEQVINHNESQLKYGVITKNIDNKKIISEFQIVNIAKKYLRFSNLPCELLAENINLPLSIDIDFSKFVQIYDEIQQKRLQIKLFEYEHYIDLINNEYETTIKGRLMPYEQYRININYWGNNDYWGDNPPKYWGGEYYG